MSNANRTIDLAGTQILKAADGTAAAPSITNDGNTNTGIFFPAADTIAFSDGGTERVRIDSSGNVGIGTANPTPTNASSVVPKLIVNGSLLNQGIQVVRNTNPGISGAHVIMSATRGTDANSYTSLASNDGIGAITFNGADGAQFIPSAWVSAVVDGAVSTNNVPGRLVFGTSSGGANSIVERMRITSSGNVGIGTTSPNAKVHMSGSDVQLRFTNGSSHNRHIAVADSDNSLRFARSAVADDLTISSAGNVGIGTTSPQFKVDVNYGDVTGPAMVISGGRTSGGIPEILFKNSYWNSGNYGAASIAAGDNGAAGGYIAFKTTQDSSGVTGVPTERLRINSAGNILVAGNSIDNNSVISVNGSASRYCIATYRPTSDVAHQIYFWNTNGPVGSIYTSGNATGYNTASDYRLKENAEPISDGIYRLKKLSAYSFNWKSDVDKKRVDGFFAHEAQAIVPECVTGEKDAVDAEGKPVYQGIDQSKIVPLLTAAMQEAISKIELLESKVSALEAA